MFYVYIQISAVPGLKLCIRFIFTPKHVIKMDLKKTTEQRGRGGGVGWGGGSSALDGPTLIMLEDSRKRPTKRVGTDFVGYWLASLLSTQSQPLALLGGFPSFNKCW